MRTTISIPDVLAEQIRRQAGNVTLSEFARLALSERVGRLEREALAEAMSEGYACEASSPSLDDAWSGIDAENWE